MEQVSRQGYLSFIFNIDKSFLIYEQYEIQLF